MNRIQRSRQSVVATDYSADLCIRRDDGSWFMDFKRARFATLAGQLPVNLTVELGEVADPETPYAIHTNPGGSRRYRRIHWPADQAYLPIEPDQRNTRPPAVPVPAGLPEVMPFRFAILHGWPEDAGDPGQVITMHALSVRFAHEGRWRSSSPVLDRVDALCRHTMEATTFLGIYVDGDRERIAYEGDALINQLGHAACNADTTMAAATIEHLLEHPTWPAEWHLQLPCCAWQYLLASGDTTFWREHAQALEARGLGALQNQDGWCDTAKPNQSLDFLQSINRTEPISYVIDWPQPERDDYECSHRATAVNAWFVRSQQALANGFAHCGMAAEARRCHDRAQRCGAAILRDCRQEDSGLFTDGPGSEHLSAHANFFSLACGVIPPGDARGRTIAQWLARRGMVCSVYGAQYLIEALFQFDQIDAAHRLLAAIGPRSWHGMIEQGATMCMEAWSDEDKPNQDWNHAWGGAPANLLPRWVAGVRPTAPRWQSAIVQPNPGPLEQFSCHVPTPHGSISVDWNRNNTPDRQLIVEAPPAVKLTVMPPDVQSPV